jgi:hypothetical protein
VSGAVFRLEGNQREAVDPRDNVWLSASAGTGKTQVLSARVLRLLLRKDVDPSQILCLTFTKAGAAEMANRINAVLARWVRLDSTTLGKELGYLGADIGPETQARARTLFASVLDCPGGGLRIDTIHAFSQWLIASFPQEAGLQPGAQPMDDRTRELLARDVLADMLENARERGDERLIGAISRLPPRPARWRSCTVRKRVAIRSMCAPPTAERSTTMPTSPTMPRACARASASGPASGSVRSGPAGTPRPMPRIFISPSWKPLRMPPGGSRRTRSIRTPS